LSLLLLAALGPAQAAQFVYEGRLDDRGQPANGRYDFKLTAFGQAAGGTTLAAPVTITDVAVKDGQFRVELDLPLVAADQVWLEVALRGSGEPGFSAIPGRSKAIAAPLIGACWSTTGDSGSNPATNFIGTTDAQPFVVRTNNAQSLRIEPSTVLLPSGLPITTNTIAGSHANFVTAGVRGATIAGGGVPAWNSDPDFDDENPNRVTDHYGTVSGGYANQAGNADGTTNNSAFATVGGGLRNTASGPTSTVGGGNFNTASGPTSTVGGGGGNTASGTDSTVGGGYSNTASGRSSTVGGGYFNTASGTDSTVGGGGGNTASGFRSTVGGGSDNCAGGSFSWAGGRRAKVRPAGDPGGGACSGLGSYPGGNGHEGTFVWADSQNANFVSTGPDQFLVRAQGGMAINTNTPAPDTALTVNGNVAINPPASLSFGRTTRQMLNLWENVYGFGVQPYTLYARTGDFFAWFRGGSHSDTQYDPGTGGELLMTLSPPPQPPLPGMPPPPPPGPLPVGVVRAQAFNAVSDRAAKTAFAPVDVGRILAAVLQLPITSWSYRNEPTARHLGPVAQDFYQAFGLGDSDRTISTVDANGVALAAIQGLNAKLEAERDALQAKLEAERDALLTKLEAENTALRAESAELRARLQRLEALVIGRGIDKEH
jgi:hypothetical protein